MTQRPTIWFEVDDFIQYFDRVPNPSGIQRVQMEIFAAAQVRQGSGAQVRFCRLNRFTRRFESVDFGALTSIFEHPPLTYACPESPSNRSRAAMWILNERVKFRSTRHELLHRALGQFRRLTGRHLIPGGASAAPFKVGDVLLCTGAAWDNPHYGELIADVRREFGVRFTAIVYDLIPLTHPQWVGRGYGKKFQHWLMAMLGNADLVLTISSHSRSVLTSYAESENVKVPRTEVLPLGAGFRVLPGRSIEAEAIARLPPVFVLFVSTLEPRKNHRLLVRVWGHLIEKHGERNVPSLVFVGRLGWMIDDLMAELERSGFLSGKIIRLSDLSDADVRKVYRRCLFSVFPSRVEGWGLPVAESLEQGKFCIASDRASIPEVGGDLVDYIDPDDEAGTLAAIERAIFDDAYRGAREARIRAEYRPGSWASCAEVLIASAERLGERSARSRPTAAATKRRSLPIGGTTS